jgi:hypothetical protein
MTARERAEGVVRAMGYTRPSAIELHRRKVEAAILAAQSDERERCAHELDCWRGGGPLEVIAAALRALPPEDVKP